MAQASEQLKVSSMVVGRLIAQKLLPARQVVKYAPWVIERTDLDLPVVRKAIWLVHEGLRDTTMPADQTALFVDV
jgi:hypothetical protein